MQKICKNCSISFEILGDDLEFYKKVSPLVDGKKFEMPSPTLCPDCRQQRRLAFRNERNLYKRNCDLCQKNIISMYGENVSFPVYCVECWWSDKWDPLTYGRDFDFQRPLFDQLKELFSVVPKTNLLQLNNENCEYNNLMAYSKNAYMSPGSYFLEDCYYCRKSQHCRDCLDNNFIDHSELLRSCINCSYCYNCHDLINCRNCNDCAYMADCIGCTDCFMCVGLKKKKYCIKNKQYSEEDYKKFVEDGLKKGHEFLKQEFLKFYKTVPKRATNLLNCEDTTGDYDQNCKSAHECYDCFDLEDSKFVVESVTVKDSMDLNMHDKDIELCYENCAGGESNNRLRFTYCTVASNESDYLNSCFYLTESFGCDGFHAKQKHCILNKKYSEEEYKKLRAQILEYCIRTGEYGEFFPVTISPFAYNETVANDYYPMTKEQVIDKGWRWKEKDKKEYLKSDYKVPEKIEQVNDNILNEVLACEKCGKNYRILASELALCRKMKLSLSTKCPDCRYSELLALKNPMKLRETKCDSCGSEILTTCPEGKFEKVYCEKCYLEKVY